MPQSIGRNQDRNLVRPDRFYGTKNVISKARGLRFRTGSVTSWLAQRQRRPGSDRPKPVHFLTILLSFMHLTLGGVQLQKATKIFLVGRNAEAEQGVGLRVVTFAMQNPRQVADEGRPAPHAVHTLRVSLQRRP